MAKNHISKALKRHRNVLHPFLMHEVHTDPLEIEPLELVNEIGFEGFTPYTHLSVFRVLSHEKLDLSRLPRDKLAIFTPSISLRLLHRGILGDLAAQPLTTEVRFGKFALSGVYAPRGDVDGLQQTAAGLLKPDRFELYFTRKAGDEEYYETLTEGYVGHEPERLDPPDSLRLAGETIGATAALIAKHGASIFDRQLPA